MKSIIVVLIIYLCVLFGIGVYYSRKSKNVTDFLLAGRNLGLGTAILTMTATLFGGALLTGTTQQAYDNGIAIYIYPFSSAIGMVLVGLLIQKMAKFSTYTTVTEYLEKRYNSKFLRVASAFLSMMALIGILGGQVGAIVGILNALGFTNATAGALLAMVVIIALTVMGGLWAVTMTDCFQIILVIVGVLWVFFAALGSHGGFSGITASLNGMTATLPQNYNVFMNGDKASLLTWLMLPAVMYLLIGQDMYQRLFACRNHKTAVKTAFGAGLMLTLLSVVPVVLGLIARIDFPELAANGTSASAFAMLTMATLPSWAVGIVMAAAISAILSTADSALTAAASHFMGDFWMCYVAKDADPDDKRLLYVSRVFTAVAGLAAIGFSMLVPSIINACTYSYYLYTGGVFAPIVFGVLWKKATREGAISGLVIGCVFTILSVTGILSLGGLPGELFSGIISSAVLVVVSLMTAKNHEGEEVIA